MKALIISAVLVVSGFSLYKLFQNPEKQIKKKTEYLIKLVSAQNSKADSNLLSKVTKMVKYIHYDVQFKAQYKEQVYQARSLNEFRSLLTGYFKYAQASTEALEHKNLTIQIQDDKKKGLVQFDVLFNRGKQKTLCKAVLEWLKEKKWFVKKIEVHSCKKIS